MNELDSMPLRTPGGNQATFLMRRGTSDWNTVASATAFDEYKLAGLNLEGWAIDIGAHVGSVGIGLAIDNPGLHVVCIEPVPDNVDLIRRNAEVNGVADRVFAIQSAIGLEPGEHTKVRYGFRGNENAEHHAWIGNATLVYPDAPVEGFDEVDVECVNLAKLADWLTWDRGRITFAGTPPALVKVDCEGGEWGALHQIVALRSPHVVGEWHPVCGRSSSRELVDAFEAAGYTVEISGPDGGPGGFTALL